MNRDEHTALNLQGLAIQRSLS